MTQWIRSMAPGLIGLALGCAAVGLWSDSAASADTMVAEEVVAKSATPEGSSFDPDFAAGTNGLSQKARQQLQRAQQYQQWQRQIAQQQKQFQQWRQGKFGQTMAAVDGSPATRSTSGAGQTASAFDPSGPEQERGERVAVVYTVRSKPLPKTKGRLIYVSAKRGGTTQPQ